MTLGGYLLIHSFQYFLVDAKISFPSGLLIAWEGAPIGTVAMADIQVLGDVGASISAQSKFEVADVTRLAEFTKVSAVYLSSFRSTLSV